MRKPNNFSKGFTLIEIMVALSVLALGVTGVAQLRHSAYRHIGLTHEIQEASYFADTHLATLATESVVYPNFQAGQYSRGLNVAAYPWELRLEPLDEQVLQPQSNSLSGKVRPISANLSVWVDQGERELRFHTLLLLEPAAVKKVSQGTVGAGVNR